MNRIAAKSFGVEERLDTIRRLGIEPDKHFKGKVVQVTGLLQPGQPAHGTGQFQIMVSDLTQIEVVRESAGSRVLPSNVVPVSPR